MVMTVGIWEGRTHHVFPLKEDKEMGSKSPPKKTSKTFPVLYLSDTSTGTQLLFHGNVVLLLFVLTFRSCIILRDVKFYFYFEKGDFITSSFFRPLSLRKFYVYFFATYLIEWSVKLNPEFKTQTL